MRNAQRAFSFKAWMDAKSESFSAMSGETVTRRQVILVNLALMAVIMTAIVVETSLTLSMCMAVCAAWAVYVLNKTEKGGDDERA